MRNVLHIGMPKTGTTTLQADVFPDIARRSGYQYLGLLQPYRKKTQTCAMSKLHRWMMCGEDEAALYRELTRVMASSPLIISNEAILMSNTHSSWHTRVRRLEDLIKQFDFQIYITIREPVAAMYSYFCDNFLASPDVHRPTLLEQLAHGDRLEIYKYAASIPFIEDALKTNLVVESYEDIFEKKSSVFLSSLTPDGKPFPEHVEEHNKKRRIKGRVVFENTTLRDTLRRRIYAGPVGRNPLARKVIARLGTITSALDLVRMPAVEVPALGEQEIALLRAELQADVEFVASRYGINFPAYPHRTKSE